MQCNAVFLPYSSPLLTYHLWPGKPKKKSDSSDTFLILVIWAAIGYPHSWRRRVASMSPSLDPPPLHSFPESDDGECRQTMVWSHEMRKFFEQCPSQLLLAHNQMAPSAALYCKKLISPFTVSKDRWPRSFVLSYPVASAISFHNQCTGDSSGSKTQPNRIEYITPHGPSERNHRNDPSMMRAD